MRCIRSFSLLSLFAASSFALQLGAGLEVGVQKAWVDRWAIETPLVGFNVPLFVTDEHGVQLSIRYSPKGWENDSGYSYSAEWLHYLDVPLKWLYYPGFFPIRLGFSFGVNYSILMGVSYGEADGLEPFDNYKEFYTDTDYGLLFGVHFQRPLVFGALQFSLEYYAGLQTIRDTWVIGQNESEDRPVKNHALSFCIGYELPRLSFGGGPLKKGKVQE